MTKSAYNGKPSRQTKYGNQRVNRLRQPSPYKKPVISRIELDPRQAVIVQCHSDAIFWTRAVPAGRCVFGGAVVEICDHTVRSLARGQGGSGTGAALDAPPS